MHSSYSNIYPRGLCTAGPYRNFVDARDGDLPRASPRISRANGGAPFAERERVGIVKRERFPCPIWEIFILEKRRERR